MSAQQLNLALSLPDDALFDNFLVTPGSARLQVIEELKRCSDKLHFTSTLVWGACGSGLTHLLQATCHEALRKGQSIQYLALDELIDFPAREILQGLNSCQLVCIDNIHKVVGEPAWEEALFHLFNAVMDAQGQLVMSSEAAPRNLAFQLADLKSRLTASTVFQLPDYSDDEKAEIVQYRANIIGLHFSNEALSFLMNRAPRDLHSLLKHLHRLDSYTLQYQSKPTIPLMKKAFGW